MDKQSKLILMQSWVKDETDVMIVDNTIKCLLCEAIIVPQQRSDLKKHLNTKTHLDNKFGSCSRSSHDFNLRLTKAFMYSNIPVHKLSDGHLREFLGEYCNKKIPDPSTLRKYYIDKVYDATIADIRREIGDCYIYVILDEITDVCGRYIGNLLIGTLKDKPSKSYLLASKQLVDTEWITIVQFIDESLKLLWQGSAIENRNKFLVFITDASSYTIKAALVLKNTYRNLIHCTCFAHALNRVAKQVAVEFSSVNRLVTTIWRVFLKAPNKTEQFRKMFHDLPLPPELTVACWATWLDAVKYYGNYFDEIKNIVCSFDSNESLFVTKAQTAFNDPLLKDQLRIIISSYSIISSAIRKFESQTLSLNESFLLLYEVQRSFDNLTDEISLKIKKRLNSELERNPGFCNLRKINNFLNGDCKELPIAPEFVKYFKFCPVASVKVERTFFLINDRRQHIKVENMEKLLVTYYKYNCS